MPYTGNPATVPQDEVRALVGDMDPAAPILPDEVYDMIVARENRLFPRAAMACDAMAGHYGHQYRKRVGPLWREAETLFLHFRNLSSWYRQESMRRPNAIAFVGGLDVSDVETRSQDTGTVQPEITVGMLDSAEDSE